MRWRFATRYLPVRTSRPHRGPPEARGRHTSTWTSRPGGVISGRRDEDLLPELRLRGTGGERRGGMLSPHRGRPCWIPLGLLLAAPPPRFPPCHPLPGLGPEAHLPGLRMAESDSPRLLTERTPDLVRVDRSLIRRSRSTR